MFLFVKKLTHFYGAMYKNKYCKKRIEGKVSVKERVL